MDGRKEEGGEVGFGEKGSERERVKKQRAENEGSDGEGGKIFLSDLGGYGGKA